MISSRIHTSCLSYQDMIECSYHLKIQLYVILTCSLLHAPDMMALIGYYLKQNQDRSTTMLLIPTSPFRILSGQGMLIQWEKYSGL